MEALAGHQGRANRVQFSPNTQYLASCGYDGTAHIWKMSPGSQPQYFDVMGPLRATGKEMVYGICWHPHQALLLAACADGQVRVFDVLSGGFLRKYTGHKGTVRTVQMSGSGAWVASGGADPEIHIWDLQTHLCPYLIPGHEKEILSLCWSPDSTQVASSDRGRLIQVYDLLSKEAVFKHQDDEAIATDLAFSPDGTMLAAAVYSSNLNQVLRVWNLETGEARHIILWPGVMASAVCWSPDGRTVLVGTLEGFLFLMDLDKGKTVQLQEEGLTGLTDMDLSSDGFLATAHANGEVRLWVLSELLGGRG